MTRGWGVCVGGGGFGSGGWGESGGARAGRLERLVRAGGLVVCATCVDPTHARVHPRTHARTPPPPPPPPPPPTPPPHTRTPSHPPGVRAEGEGGEPIEIELTQEEAEAVERLTAMGFPREASAETGMGGCDRNTACARACVRACVRGCQGGLFSPHAAPPLPLRRCAWRRSSSATRTRRSPPTTFWRTLGGCDAAMRSCGECCGARLARPGGGGEQRT